MLAACAAVPAGHPTTQPARAAAEPERASVLLVSIDGFRADYLDLGITPNLARIAATGVRAAWMNPSYPTLTFPNHYTLVTGLRPDRHGIVHNTMHDVALGAFSLGRPEAVGDGRWWGGEPVWVAAENAGLPTATMFWPGSEAAIDGVRPTRWRPFDSSLPAATRVDIVLGWLSEPTATRPRFATLYFDQLDHESHDHGPDSTEAHAAIRELDATIGRLLDGLAARGLDDAVNLVVVSDHGMATVEPGQVVAVEDMVAPRNARLVTAGQSVGFALLPGREAAAQAQLLGRHERYECWRKDALPDRWHYGAHLRVPPIVCQMDEGWDARPRERIANRPSTTTRGSHGFDPALPSMQAIFLARGPAFRKGTRLPAFDNVDVYPLLMALVGLQPAPNDGDADAMAALKPTK
ncbi:ectonucleotide pyrophosphatase/phosphodiesterase [Lysobacter erysipheiresistens]|uniref:Ectonucleotide pyrophosphatase/phosphodiesterase n=1 Tax=Novilysobacter erysipheiresistens TaxID=1749332 RepID=A0ABU7YX76_9GAMM